MMLVKKGRDNRGAGVSVARAGACLVVLLLITVAPFASCGDDDGVCSIEQDAEGNVHINTAPGSNATVFIGETNVREDIGALIDELNSLQDEHTSLSALAHAVELRRDRTAAQAMTTTATTTTMTTTTTTTTLPECASVSFSGQLIIAGANSAASVAAADLDGDGDLDVVSGSFGDSRVSWYENMNGLGTFAAAQVISSNARNVRKVFTADLDGDGDVDVLSASVDDNKIAWYENMDGNGTFSQEKIITTSVSKPWSGFAADLDGDGDMDVLSASEGDDKVAWYENLYGNGTFSDQKIIARSADGPRDVFAADIDGDGDLDVLSVSFIGTQKIAWYENVYGNATVFASENIITTATSLAFSIYAADLDNDGDVDVVSASAVSDRIAWHENADGKGNFSPQQSITTSTDRPLSVIAADLDNDGDMDIVSASDGDNKVAWFENTNGAGSFSGQKVITGSARGARSVFAADLDGDGDLDVLSASNFDNKIAWYKNNCV